jgi:uncharacterized membrane protein YhaH (DUF805 family)
VESQTEIIESGSYGLGSLIVLLIYIAVLIIPFWKLWSRTGHSGWMALLMLVPVVNFVMIWVLAFKRWPALDGAERIERRFE